MFKKTFVGIALGVCVVSGSVAEPYIPVSDEEILEKLPVRATDPLARELAGLRRAWQAEPKSIAKAAPLARRYFELAAAEGDPRYVGYAQAVLAAWWDQARPPDEAWLLRAMLRQWRHDFVGARADLTGLLAADPANSQAWAWLAAIETVQARYADARRACEGMKGLVRDLLQLACVANLDSLTGHAAEAHRSLAAALAADRGASPELLLWIHTRLAEMAQRAGLPEQAQAHYDSARALGLEDAFLTASYADFLLDRGRPAEAAALLKPLTRSDIMLLRLALAEKALGAPTLPERVAALRARFDAARMRGDRLHRAEEARFALFFENQPAQALEYALENWQDQREPPDARIVLEAALAAGQAAAAAPVLDWLKATGHEDAHIRGLAAKLAGGAR